MVEVHELDEGFRLAALENLLLAHVTGDGLRSTLQTGNEAVAEGALLGAIIEALHNDGLLASEATRGDEDDFARLDAEVEKRNTQAE